MGGSSSNDTGGSSQAGMTGSERTADSEATASRDRPDDNNRGGAQEAKESFDRAMDNANRPDRAPAAPSDQTQSNDNNDDDRAAGPPGIGAPPSSTAPADQPEETETTDNGSDHEERGFLDRVADALTAPPTDAEGNPRSTSPVADRLRNHTVNYSIDDIKNFFTPNEPPVTPEQSLALEEGEAVMEGVIIEASYPRQTGPAPLSKMQAAMALADAELAVGAQVYQREAEVRIDKIDERLNGIDEQLEQDMPFSPGETLDLYDERNQLSLERDQLTKDIASSEATFEALRGGGPAIGLSPEVLEKVVEDRNELDDRINPLQAELDAMEVTEITDLTRTAELQDLEIQFANRLDLGLAYQDVLDQEAKLADGETITVSAKHPYEDFVVERLVDGVLSLSPPAKGVGTAVKWGSKVVDNVPATSGPQLTINRRDDGVYEVMQLMEPFTNAPNNGVYESRELHYEIQPDGRKTLTKEVFNPVPGNPMPGEGNWVVRDLNRPADGFDLENVTHGRAAFIDGEIRINPAVREAFEKPIAVDSSPP